VRPGKPDGAAHGLGQPLAASTLRRPARRHYGPVVRTNLTVGDLGDLQDKPLVAVLATLRTDGTVLLSPVYHEWRDGGFNIWVEQQNVKTRHLRRDPRATVLVAESDPPLRAVEVRGPARFVEEGVPETALRIAARYPGPEEGAADVEALRGADVIVRIEPGDIRVWDYADEFGTS
jgi:PPOX class probable F420-dependent enzyme